jgi:hypothetical protein
MYVDARSFLEDERGGFRAYEALESLTDWQLEVPVAAAGGWSGRDLMGHILTAQEVALASARELAVGEQSLAMDRFEAAWDADPGAGDAINEEELVRYRAMPLADLRARFRVVAVELRGCLAEVPEARWIQDAAHQEHFQGELTAHYEAHAKDLEAILAAAS